jgi:hypothetical protein
VPFAVHLARLCYIFAFTPPVSLQEVIVGSCVAYWHGAMPVAGHASGGVLFGPPKSTQKAAKGAGAIAPAPLESPPLKRKGWLYMPAAD